MLILYYKGMRDAFMGLNHRIGWGKPNIHYSICSAIPGVHVEIENLLDDGDLALDAVGFTRHKWTRFLRTYLRPDFLALVEKYTSKMLEFKAKPSVAGYIINTETGHTFGSCIQSLNWRLSPQPEVYLFSRATQIDRAGFCDLALMNWLARKIAKKTGAKKVRGIIITNLMFISAMSTMYHLYRFNEIKLPLDKKSHRKLQDHNLRAAIRRFALFYFTGKKKAKYGPTVRFLKRCRQWRDGKLTPKGSLVRDLTVDKLVFQKLRRERK